MARSKSRKSRYVFLIAGALSIGLIGVGAMALVRGILSGGASPSKKVAQEIHIIRPPPPPDLPPPPPPPPDEKVDVPDPQEKPDPTPSNDPPPGEQLGLDAEGTAGGDAFGLVGNKGGRGLVGSGGSALKRALLRASPSHPAARHAPMSANTAAVGSVMAKRNSTTVLTCPVSAQG